MFRPHLIQLHNQVATGLKQLLAYAPANDNEDSADFQRFKLSAGIPFLQAFMVGVRRACVAG